MALKETLKRPVGVIVGEDVKNVRTFLGNRIESY